MSIKRTPALNKTLKDQDLFPDCELLIKSSKFSYKHTRNYKFRFDDIIFTNTTTKATMEI